MDTIRTVGNTELTWDVATDTYRLKVKDGKVAYTEARDYAQVDVDFDSDGRILGMTIAMPDDDAEVHRKWAEDQKIKKKPAAVKRVKKLLRSPNGTRKRPISALAIQRDNERKALRYHGWTTERIDRYLAVKYARPSRDSRMSQRSKKRANHRRRLQSKGLSTEEINKVLDKIYGAPYTRLEEDASEEMACVPGVLQGEGAGSDEAEPSMEFEGGSIQPGDYSGVPLPSDRASDEGVQEGSL